MRKADKRIYVTIAHLLKLQESDIEKIEPWHKVFKVKIKNQKDTFVSKLEVYKQDNEILLYKFLKTPMTTWDFTLLEILNLKQLQNLCLLLGIPYSGTKRKLYERLEIAAELRLKILPFYQIAYRKENKNSIQQHEALVLAAIFFAGAYKSQDLRKLAKLAKIWIAPTKYGNALGLINWLRRTLLKGQQYYKEVKNSKNKKQKS